MSLNHLIPSLLAAYAPATQPSYQRVHITVEEENSRLRAALAAQGALLHRHQDALLKDIFEQIGDHLKKHPTLGEEIRAALQGVELTKGSLLHGISVILSKPVEEKDQQEWAVVDPHRSLALLLSDFHLLSQLPSLMPTLEEKIDIEELLLDINSGGTSKMYHIGRGIWVTGSYLFQTLSILFRITRLTVTTLSMILYNPVLRATVLVGAQILSAT